MTDKQKLELIRELILDYFDYSADEDVNQHKAEALISAVYTVVRFGDDAEK